ncbi:glucosamine-6-phosphate deaminase, partial [Paenibacillus sp. MCAF20]
MEIIQFDTQQELDSYAARYITNLVKEKPQAVLGLATGSTPIGIYDKIVQIHNDERVSFKQVTTYNLDEYVGLQPQNDQSYAYYMNSHLFSRIDIVAEQTHLPNGMADDVEAECIQYDEMLAEQPVDVQLLGLGHNGHIGFNEPDQNLSGGTH